MTLHSADPLPPAPSERFNFADHLTSLNRGRSAKPAYIDDLGVLTYGELADRVARFAGGLVALGVRAEERVLLLMHDCIDWPVAFLGCLQAGVVPVALNTRSPSCLFRPGAARCRKARRCRRTT